MVYMGYHVPAGSSPDFGATALLAQVLGDTPGGRLHKALVEKGLAAGFYRYLTKPIKIDVFMATLDEALTLARARADSRAISSDSTRSTAS